MSDQGQGHGAGAGAGAGPSRPRPETTNNGRTPLDSLQSTSSSHTSNTRPTTHPDQISLIGAGAGRPAPLLNPAMSSTSSNSNYSTQSPTPTPTPLSAGSNTSTSTGSAGSSSKLKRRPLPLVLGPKARQVGVDEERSAQLEANGLNSATSAVAIQTHDGDDEDDLSVEIDNLSLLHRNVQANLLERPLESSPNRMTPDIDRLRTSSPALFTGVDQSDYVPLQSILADRPGRVVLDIRPIEAYRSCHLPGSYHFELPSNMYQHYMGLIGRRGGDQHADVDGAAGSGEITWEEMGEYITPSLPSWNDLESQPDSQVVILGDADTESESRGRLEIYKTILGNLLGKERSKVLRGGWGAVLGNKAVLATCVSASASASASVSDINANTTRPSTTTPFPKPSAPGLKSAPLRSDIPTFNIAPPPLPTSPTHADADTNSNDSNSRPSLAKKQSMPSLRSGLKRNVPSLSIQTTQQQQQKQTAAVPPPQQNNRPPKLSLNLDKSTRSNTTGHHPELHLNIAPSGSGPSRLKTPMSASFLPTSGDHSRYPASPQFASFTQGQSSNRASSWSNQTPTARSRDRDPNEPPQTASLATAAGRNAMNPFNVSTILPHFLYLGPEITSKAEIKALQDLGIKRILNVAKECEDDQNLGLGGAFEKYTKIPMRDSIEETGVSEYMREACDLLDDARLHSSPVYVHCKAGKSRSVTVVLAYLIYANAWTLKTAYAYVAERRKGISPNIGFVAELMAFEETELGLKQSGGVHGDIPQQPKGPHDAGPGGGGERGGGGGGSGGGGSGSGSGKVGLLKKGRPSTGSAHTGSGSGPRSLDKSNSTSNSNQRSRPARDSLPPERTGPGPSSSLGTRPPGRLHSNNGGSDNDQHYHEDGREDRDKEQDQDREDGKGRTLRDEREVMKNGQWVQQRRVPVDRTTLQPGRRASKAGLESLRNPSPVRDRDQDRDRDRDRNQDKDKVHLGVPETANAVPRSS